MHRNVFQQELRPMSIDQQIFVIEKPPTELIDYSSNNEITIFVY